MAPPENYFAAARSRARALLISAAVAAEPLLKRLRVEGVKTGRVTALDLPGQIREAAATGILSEAEAAQLREYDRKVMNIVHVDDFEPEELMAGTGRRPAHDYKAQVA